MSTEILLYDLACTKDVCFSPTVWRIRLMLNYKQIPYKTIFLEFPDIESTLKDIGIDAPVGTKYTVPAIHHLSTDARIMDSWAIAQFLESTYTTVPVPLTSELGTAIEAKSRAGIGAAIRASVLPREIAILSPRAQEFFRRTREAAFGRSIEDMLDPQEEETAWKMANDDFRAVGQLLLTNHADGPFVLGARPSYTDFFCAGTLQTVREVHEPSFQRICEYPGYKDVYEACLPYMEKNT